MVMIWSIPTCLKIWDNSIYKPLQLIFRSSIENGKLQSDWNKAVPVHNKSNKQALKNYCPVSLLPICGKALERLTYNSLFEFFVPNELISSNQSGFKSGDSCINQLFHYSWNIKNPLMIDLKSEMFFLIHQKHLTKIGTMDSFINYNKME